MLPKRKAAPKTPLGSPLNIKGEGCAKHPRGNTRRFRNGNPLRADAFEPQNSRPRGQKLASCKGLTFVEMTA